MRANEKEREELKASRQTLLMNQKSLHSEQKVPYNVLSWGFYSQTPLQNTKITNQTLLQKGANQEEIQKMTKK